MRGLTIRGRGEPREVFQVEEIPVPEPAPGRVRVRVTAAAANLPDVMLGRGTYPLRPAEDPFVPGLEAAGVVDAVGADVDPGRVGQRVVGVTELPHGAFAEHAIVPADRAYAIPDAVSDADAAATLIAFQTAHVGLHRRGRLAAGETLVVLGAAGGVGSAAIQLGAAVGARVVAVARGAEKQAACAALGAAVVVDGAADDLSSALRDATDGRGADVVFDPVGGGAYTAAVGALATDARVLLVGFADSVPAIDAGRVLRGSYDVSGVYVGAYAPGGDYLRGVQSEIFAGIASGAIRPVIDRIVPLDDLVDALDDLAARRVTGKIVATPT